MSMRDVTIIKAIAFDWGGTIMREIPGYRGPMAHWPRVELMPGAFEALEELHERFACCIASNARESGADLVSAALARAGILDRFGHVFTSRDLGAEKPDPAFFREMLKRLRVESSECILVGDDYQKDIAGAKSAGLRTVWLSDGLTARAAPRADAVIGSMRDLAGAVAQLTGGT